MKIKEITTKSIIVKSKLPDADYVINPYVGCQHSCIYCYATFMKKFYGHQDDRWGAFVDIKQNASETIKTDKKYDNSTILIGSVTDPYQGLERKYQITNNILKKILSLNARVEILTKSSLVLRDLNLIKKLSDARVVISLSTTDAKTSKIVEPYASLPESRLNTLKKLKESNVNNCLFISPIFPYLTDYEMIIKKVKSYVDEIWFENLNIRGNNRKKILSFIEKFHPEYLEFYIKLKNKGPFWDNVKNDIISICDNEKIKFRIYFGH